jgi:hypothetical protein
MFSISKSRLLCGLPVATRLNAIPNSGYKGSSTMSKRSFAASLGLAAMLFSSHAFAVLIVENLAGTKESGIGLFIGQSFTTPSSGGPWDDITFNYFTFTSPTIPVATGTAFLLSQEYLGTPPNLGSSTFGFLAESTMIIGGMHVFPTALELSPGTQYFVYENAVSPDLSGGNTISGGQGYFTHSASGDFHFNGVSNNFAVSGAVAGVIPEPSTWAMMLLGFAGLGYAGYRRALRTA